MANPVDLVVKLVKDIFKEYQESKISGNTLPELTTSFNPLISINVFKSNLKRKNLIHYFILSITFLFSISIMPISFFFKLLLVTILISINVIPILGQFFNYGTPVLAWVFLFFTSKFIPLSLKQPITVKVLPALETIFYGDNLSEILASRTGTFFDIFAWLPYGLIHFALPFIVAILIFLFAPPTTLRQFAWSFGYMNLMGVFVQDLVFSCAPPWYKVLHGLENANYSMKGSPGGLARIDKLLGIDMYTSGFTNSPLIFGAMPSLHSACSTMDCLWLCYLFPRFTPLWCVYVCWLWFSTMYLTHHYFIDVVVGSCLAITFFSIVRFTNSLPVNDLFCRWSYYNVKLNDIWFDDPMKRDSQQVEYSENNEFQLNDLENLNSNKNTSLSSSSISSKNNNVVN